MDGATDRAHSLVCCLGDPVRHQLAPATATRMDHQIGSVRASALHGNLAQPAHSSALGAFAAGTVITLVLPEQTSEVARLEWRVQVATSSLPTGQQLPPTSDPQPPHRRRRRHVATAS